MEEIQRLVAPPVSEEALKKQKRGPKEYRRHGKAINHDYCDSCLEGGDLLCCDQCPVSFHLQCHDPPLEEEDVPTGEWVCRRCKVAPKVDKDDDASSTKSGSSNGGRGSKYVPPMMPIIPLTSSNPLQQLAEAAKLLNPVQFELPKDIACTTPLPGSSKRKWWGKDKNMQKKQAHELDNGMVPLPAKVCFICRKSCRVAPLLPCDYCPCLYHLDCLDPPLTSVPTGRWMCPNHIENIIDDKLVRTMSVTERVKLWNKFDDRINHHAVKLEFLKKVHRKHPPFRIKHKHPRKRSAVIPPAIKEFYQHPVDQLQPPMMDWSPVDPPDLIKTEQLKAETSLEDQEQWLKSVVSLQTSIAQFLAKKQLERGDSVDSCKSDSSSKPEKPMASVQPVLNRDFSDQSVTNTDCNKSKGSDLKSQNSDSEQILSNGPLSSPEVLNNGPLELSKGAVSLLNPTCSSINGDLDASDLGKSRVEGNVLSGAGDSVSNAMKVSWQGDKQQTSSSVNSQSSGNRNIVISTVNKQNNTYSRVVSGSKVVSGPTSILSPRAGNVKLGSATLARSNSVSGQSLSSTTKVITVSASPSASKSVPTLKSQNMNTNQSSATIITLNNTLQQYLEGTADLELSKLDEKLIQILAWQRLQQLMPSKTATEGQKKATLNGLLTSPGLQDIQARAVLCPLSGKGEAVPMPYRTLSIGTGADMDVCLGQYGQCNFISAKHAFIFYDETSKHYELLNYSEHGTTVDNVLYSCDFSDKPATTPQPTAIVASVRNLIKDRPKMKADERLTMSRTNELRRYCNCRGSSSSLIGGSGAGWEGTALLHHGSYIKVGCIQFVFSIVDHATNQPVHGVKREPMSLLKSHLKGIP